MEHLILVVWNSENSVSVTLSQNFFLILIRLHEMNKGRHGLWKSVEYLFFNRQKSDWWDKLDRHGDFSIEKMLSKVWWKSVFCRLLSYWGYGYLWWWYHSSVWWCHSYFVTFRPPVFLPEFCALCFSPVSVACGVSFKHYVGCSINTFLSSTRDHNIGSKL